jgi:DNA-binding GntR family transcriptional regulator
MRAMAREPAPMFNEAPTFRPLRRDVYETLREAILLGTLAPGSRVVEAEIARQMAISRGPIREALRQLEQDGLVEYRPRRGTIVATLTRDRLLQTYAVRAVLEGLAAALAAEHATDAQLDELRALLEEMEAHSRADDMSAMLRADVQFHERICTFADNPVLLKTWKALGPLAWTLLAGAKQQNRYTLDELTERHRPLLDALVRRDPAAASEVARAHTTEIARIVSETLPQEVESA